jgi:hypothetical protein
VRIAVIGAYGNGKTTLTTALAARLGIPRTHGQPMRNPAGAAGQSLEDSTAPQLIQLMVRRFTERVVGETLAGGSFVSDGSILHEWVYTAVRLAAGRYPQPSTAKTGPRDTPFEQVTDQIGALARNHAASSYDLVMHLPVEFPLSDQVAPISEHFRLLSDEMLRSAFDDLRMPVQIVTGTAGERVRTSLTLAGFPPTDRNPLRDHTPGAA